MSRVDLVVLGASLGGLDALEHVLSKLPADLGVPIVIAQHRRPDDTNRLATLLGSHSALPVLEPEDKEPLLPNRVYLAPADYHLLIDGDVCALSTDERIWYARPAIDVLFESAAESYGARVVSVLMTGSNQDGAEGTRAIKRHGGVAIVEDPLTALSSVAPRAALELTAVDHVLSLAEIPRVLIELCHDGPAAAPGTEPPADANIDAADEP
ncbi:MAG TPA: chemotaxis protein CheB [Haliangium sp.]|nr:chemotaxis protein CheB [Haliangium sp.]